MSAWQAALAYLEDEACVIRRGAQGRRREYAVGFVAAAYQHRTSRAQDPHLHTHVIVANMAQSPADQEWRALDGEAILRTYRLAAGYLYQAHLRAELGRTLGVEWETPRKGMAELRDVPREVIREFSTRRAVEATGVAATPVTRRRWRRRDTTVRLVIPPRGAGGSRRRARFGEFELQALLGRLAPASPPATSCFSSLAMLGPHG
jgi:conjugative relaxase-like TrwC/TraI family protein